MVFLTVERLLNTNFIQHSEEDRFLQVPKRSP